MKNKLLIDTSIFALTIFVFFLFFKFSFAGSKADTQVLISVNSTNLESNKDQVESDLNTLNSVESVEISLEVGMISIEVNNDDFNPSSVKKVLDKWGIDSNDEWEIEVIAYSDF
tara:strand:- start:330 stop:671 length:342 start_codon:yes stop_codon:yes gene_type:complete